MPANIGRHGATHRSGRAIRGMLLGTRGRAAAAKGTNGRRMGAAQRRGTLRPMSGARYWPALGGLQVFAALAAFEPL
jgi:hypothetical protein